VSQDGTGTCGMQGAGNRHPECGLPSPWGSGNHAPLQNGGEVARAQYLAGVRPGRMQTRVKGCGGSTESFYAQSCGRLRGIEEVFQLFQPQTADGSIAWVPFRSDIPSLPRSVSGFSPARSRQTAAGRTLPSTPPVLRRSRQAPCERAEQDRRLPQRYRVRE